MALDLFANYERCSNGDRFYRIKSTSPYTVSVYLSDLNISSFAYNTIYTAEISLNGGAFSPFPVTGGVFRTNYSFDCTNECISSIAVNVYSNIISPPALYQTFNLSAIFVSSLPVADFTIYPKYQPYPDPATGSPSLLILDTSNAVAQSSGTAFYGEGHTELFHLWATNNTPSVSSLWFVGNDIMDVVGNSTSKPLSLWSTLSAPELNSAYVEISTVPNQTATWPVGLMQYDSQVSRNSPLIKYDDVTGLSQYYSYFISTQDIDRSDYPLNNRLRNHIRVLPYPSFTPVQFVSPFAASFTTLPLNLDTESFLSYVVNLTGASILTQNFVGTKWKIEASSDGGDWGGPTDVLTNTGLLTSIYAYSFGLGYDNIKNSILDYFKASPTDDTTVTVGVSSYKDIQIYFPGNPLSPNDWTVKRVHQTNQGSTVVNALPYAKVYTPNYFNLKNKPITFDVVSSSTGLFKLKRLWITSDKSLDTISLTQGDPLSGILTFNERGVADLTITIVIESNTTSTCTTQQSATAEYAVSTTYENFIEIVDEYDEIDTKHYITNLTNLTLPYTEEPLLSPNEWVIEDNINASIKKLNSVIQTIEQFTKIYEKKSCLYGWSGLKLTLAGNPSYVWQDLECPPSSPSDVSWSNFECDTTIPPVAENQWLYHECNVSSVSASSSGLGKYCTFWKWRQLTSSTASLALTWSNTSATGRYPKIWKYEPCVSDLNCERTEWKICNINQEYFPFDICETKERCSFTDVQHHEKSNRLIISYPTEIQLAGLDYDFSFLSRQNQADEVFPFQNIVAVDCGINGEVFVLDSVLSRVSLFQIKENDTFELFTSWGRFGYKDSKNGFNKPSDIHVDLNNVVWIADTGNKCVKKFTFNGKHLATISHPTFDTTAPISVCVDSANMAHVLVSDRILVFDYEGNFSFEYKLHKHVSSPKRINAGYKRETIYVVYDTGVIKYFRTGTIAYYIAHEHVCSTTNTILNNFTSLCQDLNRNLYITVGDKILKVPDLMKLIELKAPVSGDLYWSTEELLIHKEEYVQPWVYLKSLHRLWDNIELLRSSLFYEAEGCKSPTTPLYEKEDLVIGKNEIVSNAVWNRLFTYLWKNLATMFKHFDPACEPEPTARVPLVQCTLGNTVANPPQARFLTYQLPLPYKTISGPYTASSTDGITLSVGNGVDVDMIYFYPVTLAGGSYNSITLYTNCSSRSLIQYDSAREGMTFGYSFDGTTIPQLTAKFVNGNVINVKVI
jgi:hypothetical protein